MSCSDRCSKFRKRVLIPSTSEVYGKGISVPFREEDDLLTGATDKHRWAYACAKTLDEFWLSLTTRRRGCRSSSRVFLTRSALVRPGNMEWSCRGLFRPRSRMRRSRSTATARSHAALATWHDVVDGLTKADRDAGLFWPGRQPRQRLPKLSINDLAKRAIELTGSKSEIKYIPYDEVYGEGFEDMQRRVPSLEKANA